MNFNIVLVRPKYPRNVGMVSRAMENFGLTRLIIIAPRCTLDEEAREGAAQGQGPLRNAVIYDNWDAFLATEPDGPRVAFSRRAGRRRQSFPIAELKEWPALQESRPVHLIFGTEDHGLSSEDLEFAHRICYFDIPGNIKSMNLSHAVLYGISQLQGIQKTQPLASLPDAPPIALPEPALRRWLEALQFDLSQERWNALVALKQMLMKSAPTQKELSLLESVIQQTLRRLRKPDTDSNNDTP